ncbi:hypothetical protein D3C80_1740850 [compost metagenome]
MCNLGEVVQDRQHITLELDFRQADRSFDAVDQLLLIAVHEPLARDQPREAFLVRRVAQIAPVVAFKAFLEVGRNHVLCRMGKGIIQCLDPAGPEPLEQTDGGHTETRSSDVGAMMSEPFLRDSRFLARFQAEKNPAQGRVGESQNQKVP